MMLLEPPVQHTYTSFKIAFITGLSNPKSCGLSRIQKQFMSKLEVSENYKLYLNFPYILSQGEEHEPIWRASIENVKQYLCCRKIWYQKLLGQHLESLSASCESVVFLAGSCGLEMLNAGLSSTSRKKVVHVFAYAPVAKDYPDYPCTLIQGSRDYVSKVYFPKADVDIQKMGHMDYLQSPEMLSLVQRKLSMYVQD
jgi:hypothetical protein